MTMRWVGLLAGAMFALGACNGASASGTSASSASARIRGGFALTPDRRIAHAIQVRVTEQGLRSVEGVGPAFLTGIVRQGVVIPRTQQHVSQGLINCDVVVCPQGCRVPLALSTNPRPVELAFVPADQLRARVRIVIPRTNIPIEACSMNLNFNVDTSRGTHAFVGLETNAGIRQDYHMERITYFRAELEDFHETPGEEIENEDFECRASGLARVICGVVNSFFRDTIRDKLREQISAAVRPVLAALSQPALPDPPGCPEGTGSDGSRCHYTDDQLVPVLLGADGEGDLGASFLGGTQGAAASWVLAAGDPAHGAEASSSGMTVNGFGAVLSRAHNACVPRLPAPPLPNIPEWANLRQNTVPGSTAGADVSIGVAEALLNHSLWNLWDAGLFCFDNNARLSRQLSDAISAALPAGNAVRAVFLPANASAATFAIHPQQPPRITVGTGSNVNTDPLLRIEFPQLQVEVMDSRATPPTRVALITTDLAVPANFAATAAAELRWTLGNPTLRNTTASGPAVTPQVTAALISTLEATLGATVARYGTALPPIALPAMALPGPEGRPVGTFTLSLPSNGIQGVTEGTSRYLGVFANLQYVPLPATPAPAAAATAAPAAAPAASAASAPSARP